jgi:hypothetical protein
MGRWPARIAIAASVGLMAGCGRSPVVLWHGVEIRCGELPDDVFAQVVVGYDPLAGGGNFPLREDVVDPEAALGSPDHMPTPPLGTVSIGDGGTLSVGFEPCVMGTDLGPANDVIVHEAGSDERVTVELRPTEDARAMLEPWVDADGYVRLDLRSDDSGGFDVDAALPGVPVEALRFDAARIRDVPGQGLEAINTPGADIDAVEIVVVLPAE